MKYIKQLGSYNVLDNTGCVQLWDFSRANENEDSRIEAVATVASICYGKPPKDAKKLVKRLQTESGGLPSSAFEFIRSGIAHSIHSSLRNEPQQKTNTEYAATPPLTLKNIQQSHRSTIATFKLKVPIFLARQIMRHRSFSYQELSRRYTDDEAIPLKFWADEDGGDSATMFAECYEVQKRTYRALLERGIRPEAARAVLGTGLYTEFWLQGEIKGLRNYFKLRTDVHTQKEHQEVAWTMLQLLDKYQPQLCKAVTP